MRWKTAARCSPAATAPVDAMPGASPARGVDAPSGSSVVGRDHGVGAVDEGRQDSPGGGRRSPGTAETCAPTLSTQRVTAELGNWDGPSYLVKF